MYSLKPPATLTGCGQTLKHSTAPSPRKPCGGGGSRTSTSSEVWRKATSPIPEWAALETPRLPCGKPSCSRQDARPGNTDRLLEWLRLLAILPYSQKWQCAIFYSLSHTVSVQEQEVEKDTIHNWESRKHQYRRQAFELCSFKPSAPTTTFHGPLLSLQPRHREVTNR